MGCSSSSESSRRSDISRSNKSNSFIDISTEPHWNEDKCWVIDIIIEGDAEVNSNFLFQADIQVIIVLLLLLLLLLLS